MKKIILLIIVLNIIGFSQQEKEKEVVGNYIELLKNYNTALTAPKLKSLSDEELLQIAREMYEVYQKYPEAANKIIWNDVYKIRKNDEVGYGTLQHIIRQDIKNRFGLEIFNILKAPYILRVKIISKAHNEYSWCDEIHKNVVVTALVEYNLSGSRYSINDTIKFSAGFYSNENWYRFDVGKEYVVPLDFTNTCDMKVGCLLIISKALLISDNKILDETQYFSEKSETDWELFRDKYNEAVNRLNIKGGIK